MLNTVRDIVQYLEVRLEYTRLAVQRQLLETGGMALAFLTSAVPFVFFLFIVSIGAGMMVGDWVRPRFRRHVHHRRPVSDCRRNPVSLS